MRRNPPLFVGGNYSLRFTRLQAKKTGLGSAQKGEGALHAPIEWVPRCSRTSLKKEKKKLFPASFEQASKQLGQTLARNEVHACLLMQLEQLGCA